VLVRTILAIAGGVSLTACSGFGSSTLNPNKIYLSPASVVSVAPRESHRYACATPPMVCMQHGFSFECRCP
jgi:hypothetical protein